jgi:hypothetical protein
MQSPQKPAPIAAIPTPPSHRKERRVSASDGRRRLPLSADHVARAVREVRPHDKITPARVDVLAREGRVPVAGRDSRTHRRIYSERAIAALLLLRD